MGVLLLSDEDRFISPRTQKIVNSAVRVEISPGQAGNKD